ncbi:MAG: flavoprotein [Candidatus Kapabacteria bacterium]|jgi:phosphopantothenoylcysteine decarboxylase/phosphopantothenate--cysteine ligase|nr:flavoprotein [Candidatus Kapabacteria bacterium]
MKNYEILNGKTVLLGVTGSIAAYKSPLLVRELVKKGAVVHVLLTESGSQFVSPLTLANLSRNKVIIDMFDKDSQTSGAWHIELAHKCDVMIIAPCSATTLGKLANAICDSPLISVAIALPPSVPLLISPAMDSTMWMHPATQRSLNLVRQDGAVILPPVEGDLSSGFTGPGRFPEINDIVSFIEKNIKSDITKNRYESNLNYAVKDNEFNPPKAANENMKHVFDKPLETIDQSISKDKWNAEYELDQLKKKL